MEVNNLGRGLAGEGGNARLDLGENNLSGQAHF
jgi:hypothetical protein